MSDTCIPAIFQNIEESCDIGINIGMRIDQGIAHPRLGRKIDHCANRMRGKYRRESVPVRQIRLDERKLLLRIELSQSGILQVYIVIIIHVVEAQHLLSTLK